MDGSNTNEGDCKRRSPFNTPLVKAMRKSRLGNMDDYPEYYYG